jgi:hypothetical protein
VDLRLRQREPSFVVTPPPVDEPVPPAATPPAAPPPVADSDDEATVRISLRLPEQLKARVEQAAARAGVSINTWLIRTASAAVAAPDHTPPTAAPSVGQRYSGWVR